MTFDPTTTPDVQEALSRRYSDDIIMLLPLSSGSIAVFNSARELCGFVEQMEWDEESFWDGIKGKWHPPKPAPTITKPDVDLNDLELL